MAEGAVQAEAIEGNEMHNDEVLVLYEPPGQMEGDAILTVGSKKIAVNKIYLSQLSDYFRALFYGNFRERETNDFVIREVDEDDFIEMLLVLLPTRKPIDENNVESLLELADRFIIETLESECLWFRKILNSGKSDAGYKSSVRPFKKDDVLVMWNAPCGELESDAVVKVGKQKNKFAINRVYLAQYSKVLYDMFYGAKYPMTRVKGVTANEFESVLRVLLPTHEAITVDNVESILKASGQLQIPSLYRDCLALLTSGTLCYPVRRLLQIAFRTKSDALKLYCSSRLPSKVHIDTMQIGVGRNDGKLSKSAKKWLSQLKGTLPDCVRPTVFFDITLGGRAMGRIVMELFSDREPKAAENFRSLCTGERGLGLSGQPLHLKGTNLYTGDGSVRGRCLNETIYGTDRLERESSQVVYDEDKPYLLVRNNSLYLKIAQSCDERDYFPFGRVIEGDEVVQSLFKDRNIYIVADCGEL